MVRKPSRPPAQAPHATPGTYLGFALQPVRLVHHLLQAPPGSVVFIEHDEDVSVRYANGDLLLEQTKSALAQNPASDRATDLWKAFANWAATMTAPNPPIGRVTFRYYVTPVHAGELVTRMHHAWDDATAHAVLDSVHAMVDDTSEPPGWQRHLRVFCGAPLDVQVRIITGFGFETDEDPVEPVRAMLLPTVRPEAANLVAAFLFGHAKITTDELMRHRQPGAIEADAFHLCSQEAATRAMMAGLVSLGAPDEAAVQTLLDAAPNFLLQLELINADDADRVEAVTHVLQTEADEILWSASGTLLPGEMDTWLDELERTHRHVRREVRIENRDMPPEHEGLMVYGRCRRQPGVIRAMPAPLSFVHGSLHRLSDLLVIGWHPDYKSFIKGEP